MEQREAIRVFVVSGAISAVAYASGFGKEAIFLFALSMIGAALLEYVGTLVYALASVFIAMVLAVYFLDTRLFLSPAFLMPAVFLLLPAIILESGKLIPKKQ